MTKLSFQKTQRDGTSEVTRLTRLTGCLRGQGKTVSATDSLAHIQHLEEPGPGQEIVLAEFAPENYDYLTDDEKRKKHKEWFDKISEELLAFDAKHGYDQTKGSYLDLELGQIVDTDPEIHEITQHIEDCYLNGVIKLSQ